MAKETKQVTIGTSAVQLYSEIVRNVIGKFIIRADPANTAKIWYGFGSGLTVNTGAGALSAGEIFEFPIKRTDDRYPDETEYYFISDAASQNILVHAH